jgi:8-amino-7-oxononanoate synthase
MLDLYPVRFSHRLNSVRPGLPVRSVGAPDHHFVKGLRTGLKSELDALNREGLLRKPRVISAIDGARVKIDGKWFVSFCSNDYLGLAQHPALKQAMIDATRRFGAGAGSARLLSGTTTLHQQLEQTIARFKPADDALLFTSGYAANLGVITTLIKKDDVVFCDELNHASLVDSARLTKAQLHIYKHCDMKHLESLLRGSKAQHLTSNIYIVTDTIFSMDGDGAPLKEIVRLAGKYNTRTIVDEAHGSGVFGKNGRGWCEAQGLEKKIDVIIGTSSKALGSIGGFVAGPQALIDYIRNKSRPFIFTTALPPGSCAATIAGLKILCQQPELRKQLWTNINYIRDRLGDLEIDLRNSISPIIPIMIGETRKTVAISQALWAKGFYVPAIRPPTVPQGQSRLRLTITAMHTKKQMGGLLEQLHRQIKQL